MKMTLRCGLPPTHRPPTRFRAIYRLSSAIRLTPLLLRGRRIRNIGQIHQAIRFACDQLTRKVGIIRLIAKRRDTVRRFVLFSSFTSSLVSNAFKSYCITTDPMPNFNDIYYPFLRPTPPSLRSTRPETRIKPLKANARPTIFALVFEREEAVKNVGC